MYDFLSFFVQGVWYLTRPTRLVGFSFLESNPAAGAQDLVHFLMTGSYGDDW